MVPSASGAASASFTRRCCSSNGSPSNRELATVTWKWSPAPVRSSTSSSDASGNASASIARNGSVAMRANLAADTQAGSRLTLTSTPPASVWYTTQ